MPSVICAGRSPTDILEAIAAGIELVVCITEGFPPSTWCKVRCSSTPRPGRDGRAWSVRTAPASSPGAVQDRHHARLHPQGRPHRRRVALRHPHPMKASTSSPAWAWSQSSCVGISGDPVKGMDFIDVLTLFERRIRTRAVLMMGEIGGSSEERCGGVRQAAHEKPVAAFIAGQTAPPRSSAWVTHAGAIIAGGKARLRTRLRRFRGCWRAVARRLPGWVSPLKSVLR